MLQITLTPHTLEFKRPAATSRGALHVRALWLVRALDTAAPELVGLGECGPIPNLSADARPGFGRAAAALVAAINAAALAAPSPQTSAAESTNLLAPWDAQLAALPSLRFGLESALLDLQRGGRGDLFASPFTRGAAGLPTHGLIWMDTPEGLLQQVDAKIAAGFNVIKMKVGAHPFAEELALLRTLRATYPQITLRLDANGAFARADALAHLHALAPLGIEFLEQPLHAGKRAALRALCAASPIPIALDEELIGVGAPGDLRALLEGVRPQGIIIKPALLGGWRAAAFAVHLCTDLGIGWWSNSLLESSIGHDAICQWTAAYGGDRIHGLGTGSLFRANFPSPIHLHGARLFRDRQAPLPNRGVIAD